MKFLISKDFLGQTEYIVWFKTKEILKREE